MKIKVLGSGCSKCKKLYAEIQRITEKSYPESSVEYITDISEILSYKILSTPGIVIDEKVTSSGTVPSEKEIIEILEQHKN
ncbi:MAG: thioredoxin family protein [Hyphomicrobiales bacterium]